MMIQGPVGKLEAVYEKASAGTQSTRLAVLCHPHPQYGGTMYDAVLDTLSKVLRAQGTDCLRFNFRGVGNSEGSFDQGEGESLDICAVVQHATEAMGYAGTILAGYSFGAATSWSAIANQAASIAQLILVAPPIGMMDFPVNPALNIPIFLFLGSADEFASTAAATTFAEAQSGAQLHVIDGANHFFAGAHADLQQCIEQALRS